MPGTQPPVKFKKTHFNSITIKISIYDLGNYILRWTQKDDVETDFKMKRLIPKPKRKLKSLKNPFQKNYQKVSFNIFIYFLTDFRKI